MLDLSGGHLAVIVMIEIAVNALLVAAVSKIQLRRERDAQALCPVAHLLQQRAHGCVCSREGVPLPVIGCSETTSMPCWARFSASASASRIASSGWTTNSVQMRRSTISSSGVAPSAACHKIVAVGFIVNNF